MVTVTPQEVRNRFGWTDADCPDEEVTPFMVEAAAWLSAKVGETFTYDNCSEVQATAIRNLAAIYLYCKLSGGSAVGLNINLGGLSVSNAKPDQLDFLLEQVKDFVAAPDEIAFVIGTDTS